MVEGPCHKPVEDGQRIEQQYQPPGDGRISQFQETDVVQEKGRAYVVAEAQKVGAFLRGDVLIPHQIGDDFRPHGKSAQEAQKNRVAAFPGDAEQTTDPGSVDPVQIMEEAGFHQEP